MPKPLHLQAATEIVTNPDLPFVAEQTGMLLAQPAPDWKGRTADTIGDVALLGLSPTDEELDGDFPFARRGITKTHLLNATIEVNPDDVSQPRLAVRRLAHTTGSGFVPVSPDDTDPSLLLIPLVEDDPLVKETNAMSNAVKAAKLVISAEWLED